MKAAAEKAAAERKAASEKANKKGFGQAEPRLAALQHQVQVALKAVREADGTVLSASARSELERASCAYIAFFR